VTSLLLSADNLGVQFKTGKQQFVTALDDVSLKLKQGEILGIVGESGCGKSTLARAILQLQPLTSGHVYWKGEDVTTFDKQQLKRFRQQVQLVFQDPLDALNPRMTVGQIIAEPLLNLGMKTDHNTQQQQVIQILESMGLQAGHINRYPHEFSGGQCQRIGIARAMILQPELLICDEPTSALDVSIQAQIINLLMDLNLQFGVSLIFISHDLSLVRHVCDRVMVLYKGKVVETAEAEMLYTSPQHAYTQKLLASIPLGDPQAEIERIRGTELRDYGR
jgi:oligopeptide transport system ATP-binding protein